MRSLQLRLSLPNERGSERERRGAGSCCLDEQKAQSSAFWMNREHGVIVPVWMNREERNRKGSEAVWMNREERNRKGSEAVWMNREERNGRGSEAVWMNSLENSKEGSLHG
jgi:hypothetical protein